MGPSTDRRTLSCWIPEPSRAHTGAGEHRVVPDRIVGAWLRWAAESAPVSFTNGGATDPRDRHARAQRKYGTGFHGSRREIAGDPIGDIEVKTELPE
jgi:hypothetical protein